MRRLRFEIFLTATCVALALVPGCKAPEVPPPRPPEVTVETPARRDVTIFADFTGNTQAIESVEIRARVQGILEKSTFEPASFVRKGQLLFVIEQAPYIAARDRAEAEVRSSEAALERTKSDLERLEQAVKKNAVSEQEVTRARADRDQAIAALAAARAMLQSVEIDLAYTEIHSPIGGIVSRHLVDPGNLVGRNDATLLANVLNIEPIYVYFEINEQLVAQFLERFGGLGSGESGSGGAEDELGQGRHPVFVTVADTDRVFEGHLDYIDPAADPDTGTLQARAVVPNSEGRLLPGFFVRIRVPGETLEGALLVPETALSTDLGGRYLLLVDDDGMVQKRYIDPGPLEEDEMRVVLEGLEGGERFITEGLQRARPGMPVTVKSN
jgi:RND family efflux transporter MFP subunit